MADRFPEDAELSKKKELKTLSETRHDELNPLAVEFLAKYRSATTQEDQVECLMLLMQALWAIDDLKQWPGKAVDADMVTSMSRTETKKKPYAQIFAACCVFSAKTPDSVRSLLLGVFMDEQMPLWTAADHPYTQIPDIAQYRDWAASVLGMRL